MHDVTTMHTTHIQQIRRACWRGNVIERKGGVICQMMTDSAAGFYKKKYSSLCVFLQTTFQTAEPVQWGPEPFATLHPHLWNSLQQDLHNSSVLSLFKSGLNLNFVKEIHVNKNIWDDNNIWQHPWVQNSWVGDETKTNNNNIIRIIRMITIK